MAASGWFDSIPVHTIDACGLMPGFQGIRCYSPGLQGRIRQGVDLTTTEH